MAVNTGWRDGSIPVGACRFAAEGRMASIGPSALGAKGCVEGLHRFAQGGGGRPSKRRGASMIKPYNRAIARRKTSQTRFARWKTIQPPLRVMEKRHPPLVAGATTFAPVGSVSLDSQSPKGSLQHGYHRLTGFSGRFRSPTNPVRWCDSSSLATPYAGGTMGAQQCAT